jgi:hypothetical protein
VVPSRRGAGPARAAAVNLKSASALAAQSVDESAKKNALNVPMPPGTAVVQFSCSDAVDAASGTPVPTA